MDRGLKMAMWIPLDLTSLDAEDNIGLSIKQRVGCWARCSRGRIGRIQGLAKLDWGWSWIGMTPEGDPWSSKDPTLMEAKEINDLLL